MPLIRNDCTSWPIEEEPARSRHEISRVAMSTGIVAVTLAGCGQTTPTAAPPASTVTQTVTAPALTITQTVTIIPAKPAGEFPKFVDAKSVDWRFTAYIKSPRLVQLAPGVYAEPPASGEIGTLDDYTSYFGLCVDTNRYRQAHGGAGTCW
jgi:predicted small lipoprotein YifL